MSFFELFQPGLRHLREERDRQKSVVANPAQGEGGPLGIDLSQGKAKFTMPPATAPGEEDAEAEDSEADGSAADGSAAGDREGTDKQADDSSDA
jgi:hypothetical protein